MLLLSDDNDFDGLRVSSANQHESSSKQQRRQLEQKLARQGIDPVKAANQAGTRKLKLSVLKNQVAGKADDQLKPDQADQNQSQTFGTKTREQELKDQTLSAGTKATTDQMSDQSVRAAQAKDQAQEQEIGGEDA